MSLAFSPMEHVQVLEPRVRFDQKKTYAILSGPTNVSLTPNVSTSYSTSSIQFSSKIPSPATAVDRKVYLRLSMQLTFAGSGTGNLLQIGSNDALRAWPIQRSVNTMSVTLNTSSISINSNDLLDAMLRYGEQFGYKDQYSSTPSMLDQFQEYNDWVTYGSNRNPLANQGENANQEPRGGFSDFTIVSNTNTAAVVQFVVTEPIFLSPFLMGHGDKSAFVGLQTMDFNITMGDMGNGMWSHSSGGNTISSITAAFTSAPVLLFNYLSLNDVVTPYNPLKPYVYDYYEVTRFPTAYGNISAGSSAVIESNSITLNSIPKRILVFARRQNSDRTYSTSDVFGRIDAISVNWDNKSGLLSSATKQDLYNIAEKNGCTIGYSAWNKYVGSVLALDFNSDIGLSPLEAPGVLGQYQLQLKATVTNTGSNTVNYVLYIVVISEGVMTITQNQAVAQKSVISRNDVLNSRTQPFIEYNQFKGIYGSGFFDGIFNVGKKIYEGAKSLGIKPSDVANLASQVGVPGASQATSVLRSLGSGRLRGRGGINPIQKGKLNNSLREKILRDVSDSDSDE